MPIGGLTDHISLEQIVSTLNDRSGNLATELCTVAQSHNGFHSRDAPNAVDKVQTLAFAGCPGTQKFVSP